MIDFQDFGEPVTIVRDAGYSKLLTLLPKNKLKAKKELKIQILFQVKKVLKIFFPKWE